MDLTRIAPKDRQHIQKYSPGGFTVSSVVFEGPVVVFAKESFSWEADALDSLTPEHFSPIFQRSADIDLCLFGCGSGTYRVPKDIKDSFREHGLSIEAMETGAACRTFNVLLAEGRALAAVLIPPQRDK